MIHTLPEYVFLFYVYGFLGWCMEMVYMGIRERRISNRGFLIGPVCPIYGIGLTAITLLFQGQSDNFILIFFAIIVVVTSLEFVASVVLERIFHTRWWDYSDMRFNLHGRVCLETTLPFGILGTTALLRINPFIHMVYKTIPSVFLHKVLFVVILLTLSDLVISSKILFKLNLPRGMADHTAEISRRVWDELTHLFSR